MGLNWDAIGAVAELAGAVGVILSLVYLALQIRQNTAQMNTNSSLMRAESRRHWNAAASNVNLVLAQDEKVADVFRRGLASYDSLPPKEQMQFTFMISEMLSALLLSFDEERESVAMPGSFERAANSYRFIFDSPGGREFWQVHGQRFGSPEFRDWAAAQLARDP